MTDCSFYKNQFWTFTDILSMRKMNDSNSCIEFR